MSDGKLYATYRTIDGATTVTPRAAMAGATAAD